MKKIFTLFILVLNFNFINAQTDKGYISATYGFSTPIGAFASKDYNNDNRGFAKSGNMYDVSAAYKLGKYFGVSVMWREQRNPFDEEFVVESWTNSYPQSTWSGSSEDWKWNGFMYGGYGSFPIKSGKFACFETRILFGFINATFPEQSLTQKTNGVSNTATTMSATSSGFGTLLGGAFRLNLSKNIGILVSMDAFNSYVEFTNVTTTYSSGDPKMISTFPKKLSTISFGFGLAYRLGYKVETANK